MLDKNLIGKILLTINKGEVIEFKIEKIDSLGDKQWYFINESYPDPIIKDRYQLYDIEDMDYILQNQNKWSKLKTRGIERNKIQKQEKERKRIEKIKKEDLYGFTNNKTPIQHGRILKTLLTEMDYNNGIMTRKEKMVEIALAGGHSGKNRRIYINDSTFLEVTKTEYDFFNYIVDSNIELTA